MTVPFAIIRIIYLNTFYDDLYYYKNALQAPSPNTGFTRRFYSTALEKTPQRCNNVPTARCLTRCVNAAAWRSRRLHSVSTALLATAQRAPRRFATFLNAVETL